MAAKPLLARKPASSSAKPTAQPTTPPAKLPPAIKPAATGRSSAGGQRRTVRI
jgi:hypothetical protein